MIKCVMSQKQNAKSGTQVPRVTTELPENWIVKDTGDCNSLIKYKSNQGYSFY